MTIATAAASPYASLIDLQTSLGVEDLYNILEMIAVDANNQGRISRWRKDKR